jgi:hypothetical protein
MKPDALGADSALHSGAMFTDDKWEKWQAWAELIKKDVAATVTDHAVFTTFLRTVLDDADWLNETGAGYFSNFVARMYLARAALAVRRHVKNDRGSLMCLLKEIESVAHEVTFAFYLKKFPGDEPPWQAGAFGRASDDGVTLSQSRVAADIAALKSANLDRARGQLVG